MLFDNKRGTYYYSDDDTMELYRASQMIDDPSVTNTRFLDIAKKIVTSIYTYDYIDVREEALRKLDHIFPKIKDLESDLSNNGSEFRVLVLRLKQSAQSVINEFGPNTRIRIVDTSSDISNTKPIDTTNLADADIDQSKVKLVPLIQSKDSTTDKEVIFDLIDNIKVQPYDYKN